MNSRIPGSATFRGGPTTVNGCARRLKAIILACNSPEQNNKVGGRRLIPLQEYHLQLRIERRKIDAEVRAVDNRKQRPATRRRLPRSDPIQAMVGYQIAVLNARKLRCKFARNLLAEAKRGVCKLKGFKRLEKVRYRFASRNQILSERSFQRSSALAPDRSVCPSQPPGLRRRSSWPGSPGRISRSRTPRRDFVSWSVFRVTAWAA